MWLPSPARQFDSVDHGVELTGPRLFTVTWDSPSWTEGISIREQPLIGGAVAEDAYAAVWDVSTRSRWSRFVGKPIADVDLHYSPWESPAATGFWRPRITLTIDKSLVHLILGDACDPPSPSDRRLTTWLSCSHRTALVLTHMGVIHNLGMLNSRYDFRGMGPRNRPGR
jgi:hypothetical protein